MGFEWEEATKLELVWRRDREARNKEDNEQRRYELALKKNLNLGPQRATYHRKVLAVLPSELSRRLQSWEIGNQNFAELKAEVTAALEGTLYAHKGPNYIEELILEAPRLKWVITS